MKASLKHSPAMNGSLRQRAEKSLRKRKEPKPNAGATDFHELQVHQIELEMQNSELRRAQEELQNICDRYEELYDFAPCAYLTLDQSGQILEANLAAASLLGVERKDLCGLKFTRFISEQSQDAFYFFTRLLLSSEKWNRVELELKSQSRERLAVRIDASSKIHGEKAARIRLGLTDVTDAKNAQEQVQASEKGLNDFFDNAPIGIQWLGADGSILKANQAQLEMLGYEQDEYVGRKFSEFEVEDVFTRELAGRTASREILNNFRTQLRHRDGSVRSVVIDANVRRMEGKFIHFSVFTRDKLDQEILAISEREQRRIAQDLHDNLGQLLAATLHLGTALQKKLEKAGRPEAKEEAYILGLVHQALTETRSMARGLHPVRPEPNGLMAGLEELAVRTKKHFHTPCLFQCPREVLLEDDHVATHLFRIAQEAVTNAVKHGKAKKVVIYLSQPSDQIILRVEDNGRGLGKQPSLPPGMGMRIMRYRADLIDGTLTIKSAGRGGTSVACSAAATSAHRSKRNGTTK